MLNPIFSNENEQNPFVLETDKSLGQGFVLTRSNLDAEHTGQQLAPGNEAQAYKNMHRSALRQLATLASTTPLINDLRDLIDKVEEEVRKYETSSKIKLNTDALDLLGLIDELEVLNHLGEQSRLLRRRRKLMRKLSEWSAPKYLVTRTVDQFLQQRLHAQDETSKAARKRLVRALNAYNNQRNRLTQTHLRLVFSVANRFRYLGLPYDDLVQEGSIGLMKAIERFDPTKGYQFSTYAYRVISQSIHLALDKNESLVRKPFKQLREKALVDQTRMRLEQKLGRAPSARDLEQQLPDSIEDKQPHLARNVQATASALAIQLPVLDASEYAALEENEQSFNTQFLSHKKLLEQQLKRLDSRAELIVRMRYGIGTQQNYTLKEISERLNLSSERVRQITLRAIEQISERLGIDSNTKQN